MATSCLKRAFEVLILRCAQNVASAWDSLEMSQGRSHVPLHLWVDAMATDPPRRIVPWRSAISLAMACGSARWGRRP